MAAEAATPVRWLLAERWVGCFPGVIVGEFPEEHAKCCQVDTCGSEGHDQAQAFEALVVAEGPEETEAGGGDEGAGEEGAVADNPGG